MDDEIDIYDAVAVIQKIDYLLHYFNSAAQMDGEASIIISKVKFEIRNFLSKKPCIKKT